MQCTNPKCRIDVREPLELYNGEMACPKCKSSLSKYPTKFQATDPRARELFSLAELYYNYSICRAANLPTTALMDKCSLTAEEMVKKSVQYCQEAMKLGHPEALWRMAFFYDKDYVEKDKTETMRCRIAANMYLAIASSPERQFPGYGSSHGEAETFALKKRAANDLILMARNMPDNDKKYYTDALIEHGFLTTEQAKELRSEGGNGGGAELLAILKEASSKRRAPLFGIVRVKKEQVERLANEIAKVPAVNGRKVDLMFIPMNSDDKYDLRNSIGGVSPFHKVCVTADAIRAAIALAVEKASETICIYFFNKTGKHRFYSSGGSKAKIQKYLNNDQIDRLITATPGRSYIFYDDDVYMKNGRPDRIVTDLVGNQEA